MADVPLMSNPMTTQGDVVTGGASGAAGRLAIGTAGQVLTVNSGATAPEWAAAAGGGSGISSGTAMPGSPSDGDLFYRTDLDLLCRYRSTGTRWVTTNLYRTLFNNITPFTAKTSSSAINRGSIPFDYDIYLELVEVDLLLSTGGTWNASNKWVVELFRWNGSSYTAVSGASLDTSTSNAGGSEAADTRVSRKITVGGVVAAAPGDIYTEATKTGAPSGIIAIVTIVYRLIVT